MSEAPPIPTIGRIVHYTLRQSDIDSINHQRQFVSDDGARAGLLYRGNPPTAGQVFPMMITQTWGNTTNPYGAVNGQVFLDGNDTLWVSSVSLGDADGTFTWPPRA